MNVSQTIVEYLRQHDLRLTTAESCTAGKIVTLLAEVPGSGDLIESGYVVYSSEAKQRLLNVNPHTIETFNLTSCEVAREMALGALLDSTANVAVATTGILLMIIGEAPQQALLGDDLEFGWISIDFSNPKIPCGSEPARDGAVSDDINLD